MYASILSAVVAAVVMFLAWRSLTSRSSPSVAPSSKKKGGHPIALNPEEKVPMKLVEKKVGAYILIKNLCLLVHRHTSVPSVE